MKTYQNKRGMVSLAAAALWGLIGVGGVYVAQDHSALKRHTAESKVRFERLEDTANDHEGRLTECERTQIKHRRGLDYLKGRIDPAATPQTRKPNLPGVPSDDWMERL